MNKKIRVRLKIANRAFDFDCSDFTLKQGDKVIVEGDQGLVLGLTVSEPIDYEEVQLKTPLNRILRIANEEDFKQKDKNIELEKQAFSSCKQFIKELNLVMNLFSVEVTIDGTKLTFFFTAEGRIDFRQLVKLLVKEFHLRIEMRQVGIRNQSKMLSGVGRCGREICCATFLDSFESVSIRMAKDQNLSLNPTKISGLCGRLMCCLNYENDTYLYLQKDYPAIGTVVRYSGGSGTITRQNVIGNRVTIKLENNTEIEIKLSDIINETNEKKEEEIK